MEAITQTTGHHIDLMIRDDTYITCISCENMVIKHIQAKIFAMFC